MVACLALLASLGGTAQPAVSQVVDPLETPDRLAVFLDCGFCDETFGRQEMTYVDYVRDREVAHVHVLVTRENTGAGGEANTFDLIGRGPFQGMNYSTVYTTSGLQVPLAEPELHPRWYRWSFRARPLHTAPPPGRSATIARSRRP